ncbi:MAG: DNA-binding transcriptional LysR family regulator [Oceanicoccus sp.]|jgi:DNA-binding transcriptional LysR family regulator
MDQLHLMTVFVAVAELRGFAPASRQLHMSPPAVTRAVAALEKKVGVKLLARTTRFVKTTEAGQRYLADAKRILHEVERANEAVMGVHLEPKGLLRVTAPVLFGQKNVLPVVVQYLNDYPQTKVDCVFVDRVVNLLEEGFDVGVRIGHLADSTMNARLVGQVSLQLVASPEYIAVNGLPNSPQDLSNHTLIASSFGDMSYDWHFHLNKQPSSIRIAPTLIVNTNQAAINAAKQNLGISRVLSYQVGEELKQGKLKTILTQFQLPTLPVHIVHREGPNASNKIRAFIDLLAKQLLSDSILN